MFVLIALAMEISGRLIAQLMLRHREGNFCFAVGESDVLMFRENLMWLLIRQEKKLVAEIKRTAKSGNEAATKILARQLVRLRQQIANLQGSRAQMRGIATHTQAIHAQTSVAAGMKGATKAMTAMNKQMAPAKQAKVIQDFQKQSAQMDMITEMMSDAIDDALDDDEAEEETDELTNQVLDEIGVDVASQLSAAPKGKIAGKKVEESRKFNRPEIALNCQNFLIKTRESHHFRILRNSKLRRGSSRVPFVAPDRGLASVPG
nr:vacuolar protein sorting-associated protein 2 homolog 3 [Ipomoea batatas]